MKDLSSQIQNFNKAEGNLEEIHNDITILKLNWPSGLYSCGYDCVLLFSKLNDPTIERNREGIKGVIVEELMMTRLNNV